MLQCFSRRILRRRMPLDCPILGDLFLLQEAAPNIRFLSQFASGFSLPTPKKLEEIVSVERFATMDPEDISNEWRDMHIGRTHVATVMPARDFLTLQSRAMACPMFVLPVARPKGFVTMVCQAQMPHLLFTALHDFRVKGTSAAPFLTATHFPDLLPSKGLALVRGDVVLPGQLSDKEAFQLLRDLHSFYVSDARFALLQAFNQRPQEFDFREVVRELQVPAPAW